MIIIIKIAKPAWVSKHPCDDCGKGYIECMRFVRTNSQCCVTCEHPGVLVNVPPYTAEEIAEMWKLQGGK